MGKREMGIGDAWAKLWNSSASRSSSVVSVPSLKTYFPSIDAMTPEQRRFFDALRDAWGSGRVMPVDGNISYVFCLAYELIEQEDS